RDGGAHRRDGRRAHTLRHVQGGGPRDGDRRRAPGAEVGWAIGHLRPPRGALAQGRAVRRVVLRPGREAPVRAGHPWIFSGAVASGLEDAEPGEPVAVHAAGGRFVAAGYCNPRTPIAVRVLSLEDEAGDAGLVGRRIHAAPGLTRAPLSG